MTLLWAETAEHAKGEANAVRVKQGRRAGTGMVMAGQKQKRPLNCCNSSTARRVSENTALSVFSLSETSETQEQFSLH